jgi:hypothetical protein
MHAPADSILSVGWQYAKTKIPPVGFIPRSLLRLLNENPYRVTLPACDGVVD